MKRWPRDEDWRQQGLIVLDRIGKLDRARPIMPLGALHPPALAATLQTLQAMSVP
jgi:hypothetical protein